MLCGAPPPPPRAGAPGVRGGVALRLVPRSLRGEVPKEAGGPVNYGRGRPWPQGPPGREKEPRSQVHAAKEPARRLPSHSSGTSSQAPALLGAADTLLWPVAVVTTRDPQIPDSSAGLGPPSAAWSAHICSLLPHRPLWPCGVCAGPPRAAPGGRGHWVGVPLARGIQPSRARGSHPGAAPLVSTGRWTPSRAPLVSTGPGPACTDPTTVTFCAHSLNQALMSKLGASSSPPGAPQPRARAPPTPWSRWKRSSSFFAAKKKRAEGRERALASGLMSGCWVLPLIPVMATSKGPLVWKLGTIRHPA